MVASPYVVLRLDWRHLYYITSAIGVFVWLLLIAFVPETRWIRSDDELGMSSYPNLDLSNSLDIFFAHITETADL